MKKVCVCEIWLWLWFCDCRTNWNSSILTMNKATNNNNNNEKKQNVFEKGCPLWNRPNSFLFISIEWKNMSCIWQPIRSRFKVEHVQHHQSHNERKKSVHTNWEGKKKHEKYNIKMNKGQKWGLLERYNWKQWWSECIFCVRFISRLQWDRIV